MSNLDGAVMAEHAQEVLPGAQEPQALLDTDWGREWVRVRLAKKHVDSSGKWDKRAPSFGSVRAPSPYVDQFIELLDLEPGDSVFDMGCGNGAIAIPLAQAGYRVTARDFSQGMLSQLDQEAREAGVRDLIDSARMSWEDTWEDFGIEPNSFDVAFASRSVITNDLAAALKKLSTVARRHACVTVSTGYTPKISPTILHDLGITAKNSSDYLYVFNILHQMGYYPAVTYTVQDRVFHFDSKEEALQQFADLLDHASKYCEETELREAERRLPAWIDERMLPNERAGQVNHHGEIEGAYCVVIPDDIRWAFIKWEV